LPQRIKDKVEALHERDEHIVLKDTNKEGYNTIKDKSLCGCKCEVKTQPVTSVEKAAKAVIISWGTTPDWRSGAYLMNVVYRDAYLSRPSAVRGEHERVPFWFVDIFYNGLYTCFMAYVRVGDFCRRCFSESSCSLLGVLYLYLHCRVLWRLAAHALVGNEPVAVSPYTATSLREHVHVSPVDFDCDSIGFNCMWTDVLQATGCDCVAKLISQS